MSFKDFMIEHEGYREKPYKDTLGVLTIGIGFNIDQGLDAEEIDLIFNHRAMKAEKDAINIIGRSWDNLNNPRQYIIKSMVYQMGAAGFSKFKKTIEAIRSGDYDTAANEMLDSKWALQTPNRALHHANTMRSGEWKTKF